MPHQRKMMDFTRARGTDILQAAGAYDVEGALQDRGGWHLMGTARMGNDPATYHENTMVTDNPAVMAGLDPAIHVFAVPR